MAIWNLNQPVEDVCFLSLTLPHFFIPTHSNCLSNRLYIFEFIWKSYIERVRDRAEERHPLSWVHYPKGYNGLSWARLKPEGRRFTWVSHVMTEIQSGAAGTETHARMGCQRNRQRLYLLRCNRSLHTHTHTESISSFQPYNACEDSRWAGPKLRASSARWVARTPLRKRLLLPPRGSALMVDCSQARIPDTQCERWAGNLTDKHLHQKRKSKIRGEVVSFLSDLKN